MCVDTRYHILQEARKGDLVCGVAGRTCGEATAARKREKRVVKMLNMLLELIIVL